MVDGETNVGRIYKEMTIAATPGRFAWDIYRAASRAVSRPPPPMLRSRRRPLTLARTSTRS